MEEGNPITLIALPLGLVFIMFSLGLGLVAEDFRRVFRSPRGVIVGMANLLVLAPFLGIAVAEVFALPPILAVGLVLLAAAPGGTMANLLTHLARGETALSVTLTGFSSAMAVITVPLYLAVASSWFNLVGVDNDVEVLPIAARVLAITLIPLIAGMLVRSRYAAWTARNERTFKKISLVLFALIVAAAIISEWGRVTDYLGDVIVAVIALNVLAMSLSYLISRAARLNEKSSTAIALELGLHNATLAIAVGASLDNEMTIPAAVYGIFMWVTGGSFAWLMARRNRVPADTAAEASA
ncbi:MAG: bile acid:sodium symporter family protein [Solirubrobacterales bacterium]